MWGPVYVNVEACLSRDLYMLMKMPAFVGTIYGSVEACDCVINLVYGCVQKWNLLNNINIDNKSTYPCHIAHSTAFYKQDMCNIIISYMLIISSYL